MLDNVSEFVYSSEQHFITVIFIIIIICHITSMSIMWLKNMCMRRN